MTVTETEKTEVTDKKSEAAAPKTMFNMPQIAGGALAAVTTAAAASGLGGPAP